MNNILKNKWIWIGIGVIGFIGLCVWGVDATMCKEAVC
jgi:hypothetical protein